MSVCTCEVIHDFKVTSVELGECELVDWSPLIGRGEAIL